MGARGRESPYTALLLRVFDAADRSGEVLRSSGGGGGTGELTCVNFRD